MDSCSAEDIIDYIIESRIFDQFPGKVNGPWLISKVPNAPKGCFVGMLVQSLKTAATLQLKIAEQIGMAQQMALPERFGNLWISRRPSPAEGPEAWLVYLTSMDLDEFIPSAGTAPTWLEGDEAAGLEKIAFAAEQLGELTARIEPAVAGEDAKSELSILPIPWIGNESGEIHALFNFVHGFTGTYRVSRVTKAVMKAAPTLNTIGLIDNRRVPAELKDRLDGKFTLILGEHIFGKLSPE